MTTSTPKAVRASLGESGVGSEASHSTPLLIDAKQAAVMLSLGARRLWSLTNCRAIPSRKIGRSIRYVPEEISAWIASGCPTDPGAADRVRGAIRSGRRR